MALHWTMQRYRIVSPVRFVILGSLLGPLSAGAIAVLLMLISLGRPMVTAERLAEVPATLWNAVALIPVLAMIVGFVPAMISSLVVLLAARWRPIAFVEVVAVAAVVSVALVYLSGAEYFRNYTLVILVPVLPAAIVTWLVALRAKYVAPAP